MNYNYESDISLDEFYDSNEDDSNEDDSSTVARSQLG